MGQLDGLTPFKKGQSGNPAGKPKGTLNRKTILKHLLSMDSDIEGPDGRKLTKYEAIFSKAIERAIEEGDNKALQLISDYKDGKATDNKKVDLSGSLGGMDYKKKMDKLIGLMAGLKSK